MRLNSDVFEQLINPSWPGIPDAITRRVAFHLSRVVFVLSILSSRECLDLFVIEAEQSLRRQLDLL